jgi:hypothetical protein
MRVESLADLLVDEMKDLYSAEKQIVLALPKIIKAVSAPEVQDGLSKHLSFKKGKSGRPRESEYVDRLAWRKWNGHRENSHRPRSSPPAWTQRRTKEADDR